MDKTFPVRRVAMLSVHTCPLATLGGKKTGGMNVYVRDLSRELGKRGIQVDVFTRSQDDCQPRIKHDLGHGARVIHIPAGPEEPLPPVEVGNYIAEFITGVRVFAAAEGTDYDLIHSHYWLSGVVAQKLREVWQREQAHPIPIIHMYHTLGHMKNRIATTDDQRVPDERLDGETLVARFADRLVAATLAERCQLDWLYGADLGKIVVIPPGVDLDRFRPIPRAEARLKVGLERHGRNIMYAGRIEPLKGIDTLLEAIHLIKLRHPDAIEDVCVSIIGGDPWAPDPNDEMARLQAMRLDLGLDDLVTFLGAKDQATLPFYYAAASMLVMPSHYESFGMVALEAMAMGTPVIASEVGGLSYLVRDGETGFHVPSRDPEALAQRIYTLLTDRGCRELLGAQAQLHARQYAWPAIADQMLDLYAAVKAPESVPRHPHKGVEVRE